MPKRPVILLLLLSGASLLLVSCAAQPETQQQQVFGQADSTIPWNQPQKWEGQMGGLNAMRGGDEGY